MKKAIIINMAIAGILLLSCNACQRDNGIDISLLEKAAQSDSVTQPQSAATDDEYYGDFSLETEYIPGDVSRAAGIINNNFWINKVHQNKYYFEVRRQNPNDTTLGTHSMTAFIDLETGKKEYLCPDPLCTHSDPLECDYINILPYAFHGNCMYSQAKYMDTDSDFWENCIYEIDLNTKKMEKIVSFTSHYKSGIYSSMGTIGVFGDALYFYNNVSEIDPETQLENMTCQVYSYDLKAKTLSEPLLQPQKYTDVGGYVFCVDSGHFYITANGGIYQTARDFSDEVLIAEYTPGEGEKILWYLDESTGEIFLLVGNYRDNIGDIYRIRDGQFEKLSLPHENIYYFQLTKDSIYYSAYDPYLYGTDPNGRKLYEYGGGKIYVTDRETHSSVKEVFDNRHELPIRDKWYVIGDSIYLDYLQFIREGDVVWFSAATSLKKARINAENNTIIYFRFD